MTDVLVPLGHKTAITPDQALHKPNTAWDAQRSHDDMVKAMTPADFTAKSLQYHRANLQEALDFMRMHDAQRVRNMGPLTSPFPRTKSA
jgi:hypothetical protein